MNRTLGELAAVTDGTLHGPSSVVVTRVAIDSREAAPGHLFVALPGARVDGHDFLADAAARGAAAALVSRPVDHPLPQVVVDDTVAALQLLAAVERSRGGSRLVAITGSVAKTTSKEFLAELLASTYPVARTSGSRNSQVGLPAELCNQAEGTRWMVAELGMSRPGELDRLGAVCRPDALLYTLIAPVHTEFFRDLDAITEAKAELIPHLEPDGLLVLNAADPRIATLASRFSGRHVLYGRPGASALWISDYRPRGLLGARFRLVGHGPDIPVEWSLVGRHQADNLLGTACCALELGVDAGDIPTVAAGLRAAPRRGEVHRLVGGVTVVDDSYNASPRALRRLLELLASTTGRRLAVLGEMLELGELTDDAHREVGRLAAASCDLLVAVGGEPAAALADAARQAGLQRTWQVEDAEEATALVKHSLEDGDVVLVKGSRGIGLDRTVDALLGREAS